MFWKSLIIGLLLLFQARIPGPGGKAPATATQARSGTAVSSNCPSSPSCPVTVSTTVGTVMTVSIFFRDDTCTISTVTDNGTGGANTYSPFFNVDLDGHRALALYTAPIVHAATTITLTTSVGCGSGIITQAYSGVTVQDVFSTTGSGTSTALISGNYTTTSTDVLVGPCYNNSSTAALTGTAPWVLVTNQSIPTDGGNLGTADQLNVAAGSQHVTMGAGAAIDFFCIGASLK